MSKRPYTICGAERFATSGSQGSASATTIAAPWSGSEGAAAFFLAAWPPAGVPRSVAIVGAVIVAAIWLSTAAVQMPLHRRLAREGHADEALAALVRSNWLRTVLWSLRAGLSVWMLRVAGG